MKLMWKISPLFLHFSRSHVFRLVRWLKVVVVAVIIDVVYVCFFLVSVCWMAGWLARLFAWLLFRSVVSFLSGTVNSKHWNRTYGIITFSLRIFTYISMLSSGFFFPFHHSKSLCAFSFQALRSESSNSPCFSIIQWHERLAFFFRIMRAPASIMRATRKTGKKTT